MSLVTTVFYDSGEAQSIACAQIFLNKYPSATVKDTNGQNEAGMNAQVASLTDATQHKIYIAVQVDAAYTSTGDMTDAMITALTAKMILTATDPLSDGTATELGEVSGDDQPALRFWEDLYSGITPPPFINLIAGIDAAGLSDTKFCKYNGTASAGSSTSITTTQTFTVDAEIGNWVYIVSGTGAGNYAKITDNDATILSVAKWLKSTATTGTTPDNTSVYRVVTNPDYILGDVYIPYALLTYMNDVTDSTMLALGKKMIDANDNIEESGLTRTTYDATAYADVLLKGKAIYDYANL